MESNTINPFLQTDNTLESEVIGKVGSEPNSPSSFPFDKGFDMGTAGYTPDYSFLNDGKSDAIVEESSTAVATSEPDVNENPDVSSDLIAETPYVVETKVVEQQAPIEQHVPVEQSSNDLDVAIQESSKRKQELEAVLERKKKALAAAMKDTEKYKELVDSQAAEIARLAEEARKLAIAKMESDINKINQEIEANDGKYEELVMLQQSLASKAKQNEANIRRLNDSIIKMRAESTDLGQAYSRAA